eukprot:CAMPEP_0198197836 /NCGR_PEP_ID=MMETSP1445-20131203/1401_1 /TAXON_ID=36898 /ORGANISM="Pyramimonas sp., Strain CCMP2087" /LENGTH=352 /DNA_ID=CAMNT_0043867237 /DNA_START=76 /DNA_END=1134 /DNA_ORIENTATION=-
MASSVAVATAQVATLGFARQASRRCQPAKHMCVRHQLHNAQHFNRSLASTARGHGVASSRRNALKVVAKNPKHKFALLFDCDGVIVDSEELHRLAYNGAFNSFELSIEGKAVVWSAEYYEVLANTVGGGKPKMKYHFNTNMNPTGIIGGVWPEYVEKGIKMPAPTDDKAKAALVDALQDQKTELYKKIVEDLAVARPGVLALMDEAIAREDIAVGICSAATLAGFEKVVNSVVGKERLAKLDIILAGDQVERKKPDPQIYNMAREKLGIPANKCVVIEDSIVGLNAAKGAGMICIITPTTSTANGDFVSRGATAVLDTLQQGGRQVIIDDIFGEDGLLEGQCNVDRNLPLCN